MLRRLAILVTSAALWSCGGAGSTATDVPQPVDDADTAAQPADETDALAELERAITELEAFVDEHPDSPEFTPQALLRLADLRRNLALLEAGDGRPDLAPAIALQQRIVDAFPDFADLDAVLFLLTGDLQRAGDDDAMLRAARGLVCANLYPYRTTEPDEIARGAADPVPPDPYEGCRPLRADARFLPDTWLAIGDYHFDRDGTPHRLARAAVAYERAAAVGPSPARPLALYKLGWTLYKSGRFAEALRRFAELLDLETETSDPGPVTLHDEAIEYVVILLLDEDWDGDDVADADDGPARLEGLRQQRRGRPWLDEVCRRLGETYSEMGQRDLAARVLLTCEDR